jgi:glutathione synthase/RimK-type ligase-like ATP-grasp enzyme
MKYYIRVRPNNRFSEGAKLLAKELNATRTLGEKRLRDPANSTVVNWGSSAAVRAFRAEHWLNMPEPVSKAANKHMTFPELRLKNIPIPEYSLTKAGAEEFLLDKTWKSAFCRTVINGSSGEGIVHAETPEQLVDAPLYVQYIPKAKEFRVHVMNGRVIFVQEKRKRNGVEANKQIRTHENGWVFCFKDVVLPPGADQLAIDAVQCLGLYFGAVDLIYSKQLDKCFVLEVNTAPGLCETSAKLYADAIRIFVEHPQEQQQ